MSVLPFVIAQAIGAALAWAVVWLLWPWVAEVAKEVVVPHESLSPEV